MTGTGGNYRVSTTSKFVARVASLFCLVYLMAWIDKANIGYAKLQMRGDLHLGEAAFGFGASMFFIGYILIDIPVAVILPRLKPAHVLSIMVVGFGLVTMLLGTARTANSFYLLRFILGLFEGGIAPAIFFNLANWVPYADRARVSGLILAIAFAANVVGGVICGALLDLDGLFGLRGWQWLFLLTGLPSPVLGFFVLKLLPNSPQDAGFYTQAEKRELTLRLKLEQNAMESDERFSQVFQDPRVWLVMALPMAAGGGLYGLSYWLPTVIQQFEVSNTVNGLLSSFPWALGIAAMLWLPSRVDRSANSTAWIILTVLTGACAFALLAMNGDNVVRYILICIGSIGLLGLQPLITVLPTRFLKGRALAYVLPAGAITTNLAGFFSQNAIANLGAAFGPTAGLLYIAGVTAVYAVLAAWLDRWSTVPAAAM